MEILGELGLKKIDGNPWQISVKNKTKFALKSIDNPGRST